MIFCTKTIWVLCLPFPLFKNCFVFFTKLMSHHMFDITESFDQLHYSGKVKFTLSQTRGLCPFYFYICLIFLYIWNFDLIQIAQMEFDPKVICVFTEFYHSPNFNSLLTPLNHWILLTEWQHRERNPGPSWLIIVVIVNKCKVFSHFRFESYYL